MDSVSFDPLLRLCRLTWLQFNQLLLSFCINCLGLSRQSIKPEVKVDSLWKFWLFFVDNVWVVMMMMMVVIMKLMMDIILNKVKMEDEWGIKLWSITFEMPIETLFSILLIRYSYNEYHSPPFKRCICKPVFTI